MSIQFEIKRPSKARIDDIIELCAAHAEFEQSDYSKEGKAQSLKNDLFSEKPKLFCLVAIVGQKYVGYITWMKQYSTWDAEEYLYMDCLFLDDTCRGYGIGEALVEAMKSFGRSEDIHLIQWQTPDFNERAIKFYRRIGAFSKSKERFFLPIN